MEGVGAGESSNQVVVRKEAEVEATEAVEAAKKAAATRRALQLAIVDDPLRPMVPRALLPVGLDVK